MAVAVEQLHALKPPARPQRCRLQSYTHLDHFMLEPNQIDLARPLQQSMRIPTFQRSLSTPCLTLNLEEPDVNPRIEIVNGKQAHKVRVLVVEVAIALASGVTPIPVANGLGGAYFMSGRNGDHIAVAKPVDEEPFACNNPKGFTGRIGQPGLKRSVKAGESGMRELAAYLLDHGGFACVPPTALVKISHVPFHVGSSESSSSSAHFKIASLQRFMQHDCDAGDLGPSSFSVNCVHRIGILDVRLLNIDRHSGNILVRKRGDESHSIRESDLIPIDHGLCLPDWLDDPYFEWLHWPQASIPFSETELEYISNLNPYKDAKLLRTELPCLSESAIRVLIICTLFLKRAAAAGLCLGDIGQMMTREYSGVEESMSVLERISASAKDSVCRPLSNSLNHILDELEPTMEEVVEEEEEMFEFDDELKDCIKPVSNDTSSTKPLKIPGFSCQYSKSDSLAYLIEKEGQSSVMENSKEMKMKMKGSQVSTHRVMNNNINRSASFSVHKYNNEAGGISFEDLDEGEWGRFLEAFEKLLPEVFEESLGLASTHRLGISCSF